MSSSNSYSYCLFPFCFLLIVSTACLAKSINFHPKTLFLAVKKDTTSLQYITEIQQRTPFVSIKLAVHLIGQSLWVNCQNGYKSSSYKVPKCKSRQCKLASAKQCGDCSFGQLVGDPGCHKNACYNTVENPLVGILQRGEISEDVLSIRSINGSFPGPVATMPRFIFSCAESNMLQDLGKDVNGTVGFGQKIGITLFTQFASTFKFSKKFALCLSSSTQQNGVIFIGNSPYFLNQGLDASQNLIYTPMLSSKYEVNPDAPSTSDYYIKVSSISINGKNVPLNKTLLSLENDRGTSLSTGIPYTKLESSIYNAITKAFVKEMPKEVRSVPPVQPFTTCFNSRDIGMSRLGYNAPEINVFLHEKNVYWRITGANSLVKVKEDVVCLAFVEETTRDWGQAIVIGGYQLQDNLVEFDLSKRRIGFSNSLFFRQTMCSNNPYTWQ